MKTNNEKDKKMMCRKMTAALLAASLTLGGFSLPALAQDNPQSEATNWGQSIEKEYQPVKSSKIKSIFKVNDYDLYDIHNGEMEKRPNTEYVSELMRNTLLSTPPLRKSTLAEDGGENNKTIVDYGSKTTLLEHWANVAAGIFASTPSSYASRGDEDGFGQYKSPDIFKRIFMSEKVDDNKSGNLPKLLSKINRGKWRTEDNPGDSDRVKDIVTMATGLQSASNMAEVQNQAFLELQHLNNSIAEAKDFRANNEIKKMSEDKDSGQCLYSLVATRDREGLTYGYEYNLFGLVFYDFKVNYVNDGKEDLVMSALDDTDKEALQERIQQGQNIRINGFTYSQDNKETVNDTQVVNDSNETMPVEINYSQTKSKSIKSSETKSSGSKNTQEASIQFTKNIGSIPSQTGALNLFSYQLASSTKWVWETSKNQSATSAKAETTSDTKNCKTNAELPPHAASFTRINRRQVTMEEEYTRPVMISYKVAVFSMNGRLYDDNGAVYAFRTLNYQQRSFFTEIGSREFNNESWNGLRLRARDSRVPDTAKATTKLIGEKHGWFSYKIKHTWNDPFINQLDWRNIEKTSRKIGLKTNDSIETLIYSLPISLTGGKMRVNLSSTELSALENVPTKPLKEVLTDGKDSVDLMPGASLNLSKYELKGIDENNVPFCSFNPSRGSWKIVDENGGDIGEVDENGIAKTEYGTLTKKDTQWSFTANQNGKCGTVYLKYIVDDDYYKYYERGVKYDKLPTVSSGSVKTPVIKVNCKSTNDSFDGTLSFAKDEVELAYEKDKPISLNNLDELGFAAFDKDNNQLNIHPHWEVLEHFDCQIQDDDKLTVPGDGDYHLRAKYGDKYSKWIVVHAKQETKIQVQQQSDEVKSLENKESDQADSNDETINYHRALSTLYKAIQKQQDTEPELPGELSPILQSASFEDKDKVIELADTLGLFNGMDQTNVQGDDTVTVKDLSLLLYNLRTLFEFDDEVETPEGFDKIANLSMVSEEQKPALKWAMANGLDLSDLSRSVEPEEAKQFIQSCLKDLFWEYSQKTSIIAE